MSTNTTRLGLIKPAGNEPRSKTPLNTNFDILDKFAGTIVVNDGVTPPDTDLFDGCSVVERGTGHVWLAIKNGGGTYDKKYVSNPCRFLGYTLATAVIAAGYTAWGWITVSTPDCINTSAANKNPANQFIIPYAGFWDLDFTFFFPNNVNGGARATCISINGALDVAACENFTNIASEVVGASGFRHNVHLSRHYSLGDIIGFSYINSGVGDIVNFYATISAGLRQRTVT